MDDIKTAYLTIFGSPDMALAPRLVKHEGEFTEEQIIL